MELRLIHGTRASRRSWKYYDRDGAIFRGPADFPIVDDIWTGTAGNGIATTDRSPSFRRPNSHERVANCGDPVISYHQLRSEMSRPSTSNAARPGALAAQIGLPNEKELQLMAKFDLSAITRPSAPLIESDLEHRRQRQQWEELEEISDAFSKLGFEVARAVQKLCYVGNYELAEGLTNTLRPVMEWFNTGYAEAAKREMKRT
jgi:hypothetical protein